MQAASTLGSVSGTSLPTRASVGAAFADDSPRPSVMRAALLWLAFLLVHGALSVAALTGPHTPLNDVTTVYRDWIMQGVHGGGWVGIDDVWVYPTVALAPMLLAAAFGFASYSLTWLLLVLLLDGVALAVLTRGGTTRLRLGWWWLGFLLLLGPIAVGRIDSITVPLALVALVVVAGRPVLAGVLLAMATWIKVWPAALILAVLIATRRRILVLVAVAATSVAIVLVAWILGGSVAVIVGFVGQQTGRGLQIEAPISTFWIWQEALRAPGVTTSFDSVLLTYQVSGPGTSAAAAVMTPIMAVVMLAIVTVGHLAVRRGATATALLAPLGLAFTTAFIVTNKVGSPQYEVWLAVPVLIGLASAGRGARSFRLPSVLTLVIAALTQVLYPWFYDSLVFAQVWMVVLISVRNLLLVGLLGVAVVQVWKAGVDARRAGAEAAAGAPTSVPTSAL